MDRSLIPNLQKRPALLAFIISAISAVVLFLNGCALTGGITYVLPHLFYIPIILAAYFFPGGEYSSHAPSRRCTAAW